MSRRGTRKPCPGCGNEGYREVDTVCLDCQKLLDEARQARQRQAEQTEHIAVRLPSYYPHYRVPARATGRDLDRGAVDRLAAALAALVAAVATEPALGRLTYDTGRALIDRHSFAYSSYNSPYGYNATVVMLPPAFVDAVQVLDAVLLDLIPRAFEVGKAEGRNLLLSLAAGDLTMDEFSKRAGKE